MSFINSNVPTIAITPDEGSNTNYDISHSIDEVATDVEDIYFQTEKRKKKTRKHVQKKDMYATDVEDLDGSDDDFSNPIIKHDHPISINQVLDFDIPTTEENVKVDDAKSKNRRKLRTQASVSSSTNYLELNETELDNILTDLEDFDKSDEEDEASDLETSDTDLLKEIIHDSGTIAISDSVKKFLQAVPSPMATPVDGSDNEVDNSKITTKLYKNKKYISPVLTNLNDLTDTEELQCDEVKPKHKYGKNRRHTLPRKSKLDVTDDEDFEVSDNELKHRRVTVANLPKINFDEADKKTNRSLIKIPQNFNDGDSDYEEIAMFKNLQYQQSSNQFLNVSDTKNDHTTDIESMDDDSELEIEENIPNEDYSYELETSNDIIEDKFSVKNNNIYKIEESSIQKKCENWNSTENETDEETDKCESEINKPEVKHEATNIKFVHRYKKVQKIDKPNKLSLLVPSTGDENVLTDVENLDSSDDEINEIPVTVVNDLNDDYTDTESVEGEIENHTLYDIDFNVLPSCSRKLVREKEDNNYSEIVSTSLTDENVDTIDLSNETDLEELSGDDLQESYTEKYFAIELDVADANNTQYKDSLKLPTKQKFDEEETDTEDIDNMKIKPKKYKRNYHTYRDDNGKHTDIEDLVMSETENFSNLQVVDNIAGKTDTEDFDASDNEERVVPEYSRTPDILRQMGRDSVCSQEGSGLFSRQDKEKLDSKHTHNTVDIVRMSPSPTNTDEFITSADDDNFYSRADTATPVQMQQELDEASSFKVHSQNTKKIDLDAEDEVMYLKGGGFLPDVYTDTEEMGISEEEYYSANDKLLKDEWSSTKSPSDIKTSQEPVTTDAAPQDSRRVYTDNSIAQRPLEASCSKLEPSTVSKKSSYTQIDKILDYMLAEVDEQEKLVLLDSSSKLKPICVNSLKLDPSTDHLIEIPVSHFVKSPKVFETKHEIILEDANKDLDDDISCSTLNKSQDTESLFSFESISEIYFLENSSDKYKASVESLNDLTLKSDDEHIYEIIETKDNNEQDIWWEGTYRDLSIVPEEDEDNISVCQKPIDIFNHQSDSDFSQTDEYDTSDMEHNKPVKAEIKLLVKTLDKGREDIEIRSVRDFADKVKTKKSSTKPSFTLQRLFVRGPESSGFFNPNKELSKSNPELVATSNTKFPLRYDPDTYFKNVGTASNVDLYANTPFYPCYSSYIKSDSIKPNSSDPKNFPMAYCDWLVQPEDPNQGMTTSPPKLVSSEVTGESIIRDVLSKDIKPVLDQTKMFIRMESQPEASNVCLNDANIPSQNITSPELSDKASKELDNKKEKSKSSRGFFSSLKSLVGRSLDSSDSESKEEKTPKKKKKDKGTPKKNKKAQKEDKPIESKPESPLKEEKKIKALYESQELNNIPSIDEIESNGIQVTDLDAEPCNELTTQAKDLVDDVISNGQQAASKLLDGKIQEFNLEGTVTPEEIRRSTEPIIINEDEFLVVIEPNNYNENHSDYEDIKSPDAKVKVSQKSDKSDDEGKSDSLKRKSVGFLKLFGKKDSKESDNEDEKEQKVEEHRKSTGFFGLFSKKSKDEEPIVEEKENIKKEQQVEGKLEIIEFSQEVQKHMVDTADFLLKEVELFEDVRPDYNKTKPETKQDIKLSESKVEQKIPDILIIPEEIQQQIIDTSHFLATEIELFEDVRPQLEKKEIASIQKEVIVEEPEEQIILSEEIQQQMLETQRFILTEIENFEDVKSITKQDDKQDIENLPTLQPEDTFSKPIQKEEKSSETFQKQSDESSETKPGFFTKLGEKFSGKSIDKKEETKEKKIKKKKEKKPGFLSKIGEKFSSLSDDERETKKAAKEDVKEATEGKVHKIANKIDVVQVKDDIAQQEAELISIAEQNVDKVDQTASALKHDLEKVKSELDDRCQDIANEVQSTFNDTEVKVDAASRRGEEAISDLQKGATDTIKQAKTSLDDSGEKIEAGAKSTKESVNKIVEETSSDVKDTAKEVVEKTGGFFSSLGKKIKGSAKETKDEVVSKAKSEQEKIKDAAIDTKDTIKDSADETEKFLDEMGAKIKGKAHDAQDSAKNIVEDVKEDIEAAKHKTDQKLDTTVSDLEVGARDTIQKTDTALNETVEKIKKAADDTKNTVVAAKDSLTEKVTDTVSDSKNTAQDAVEKTEGFFSSLGKKIKGSSKDTKEDIVSTRKLGSEKIKTVALDTKDSIKESSEKTEQFLGDVALDAQDSSKNVKDSIQESFDGQVQKVKETIEDAKTGASDTTSQAYASLQKTSENIKENVTDKLEESASVTKDTVKEATEKTGGFFSSLGKKIKGSAKDTKDEVVSKTKSGQQKLKDVAVVTQDTLVDSADKTKEFLGDISEKVKTKAHDSKDSVQESIRDSVEDAKDNVVTAKDNIGQKVEETVSDLKVGVSEIVQKADTSLSETKDKVIEARDLAKGLKDSLQKSMIEGKDSTEAKFKEVLKDTEKDIVLSKDKASQKIEDTVSDIKFGASETIKRAETALDESSEKITKGAKGTQDNVIAAKDSAAGKVEETVSDIKDTAKDAVEKTGEFLGGLGKRVKWSDDDSKEEVISKAKSGHEKIKTATADTKDKIIESAESTKVSLDDVKKEIDHKAQDLVRDTVKNAEEQVEVYEDRAGKKIEDLKVKTSDVITKTGEALDETDKKITKAADYTKDTALAVKESATDKVKETASDAKEAVEKTGGFFSSLGKKIKGSAKDTKDDVSSKAKSGQEKVKDAAAHTKDTIKVSTDKAGEVLGDVVGKIKEEAHGAKESTGAAISKESEKVKKTLEDTKETIITTKDNVIEKVKESASDAKNTADDAVEKTGGFFSGLGKKIKGSAKDTKEEVVSKAKSGQEKIKEVAGDTKDTIKESTDKAGEVLGDVVGKIKEDAHDAKDSTGAAITKASEEVKKATEDTKENITAVKDSAVEQVQESASDIKDSAKDAVEKTGGFFSSLGKKIKGAAKDTKEEVESKAKSGQDKIKDVAAETEDTIKESTIKTGEVLSDVVGKIEEEAHDAKDLVVTSVSGASKKVKKATEDTKESIITTKDSIVEKVKESTSDVKDKADEAADKTGGFFSGLGKKIKGSAKDTKDEVVSQAESGQEKIMDVAADTKDTIKVSTDKAGEVISDVVGKIKEEAHDAKESIGTAVSGTSEKAKKITEDTKENIITTKDNVIGKVKESASDVKDKADDAAEKTGGFFSGLGKKIKGSAKDTKDEVVSQAKLGQDKISDVAGDTKDTVKLSTIKTGELLGDVVGEIKEKAREDSAGKASGETSEEIEKAAKDTKESIITTKDSVIEKAKESASDKADDAAEKTGGFLSGLGKKIKGSAKDTKEEIASKAKLGQEKVKEVADDTKDTIKESTDKAGEVLSDVVGKIKVGAHDTRDSAVTATSETSEKMKMGAEDAKENIITSKDSVSEQVKESAIDAKDATYEVADKTEGFFSGSGNRIKGSAKDTTEEVASKAKSSQDKIKEVASDTKDTIKTSTVRTGEVLGDVAEKIKEKVHDAKDSTGAAISKASEKVKITTEDTKENVITAKDNVIKKVEESASDIKAKADDAAEKTGGFFSGLGNKIKGSAKDTKVEVVSKAKSGQEKVKDVAGDTKDTIKESTDKAGEVSSNVVGKIKEEAHDTRDSAGAAIGKASEEVRKTTEDTKESIITTKDNVIGKVKESASDVKDSADDAVQKTGGFFSGLGKKIKGSAKDTEDEVASKAKSGEEKIEEVASDTRDTIKESADKTGEILSDLAGKIKEETKDEVASKAKSGEEKIKEVTADTRDTIKESADKTGEILSDLAGKIKEEVHDAKDSTGAAISRASEKVKKTSEDTKENIITTKDNVIEKVKESASDVKDKADDAVEKTGGFFSGLGKKIKGSAKDTKNDVASRAKSGEEKIKEVAGNTKDTIKVSTDKVGEVIGDVVGKIKVEAHDAKDSAGTALSETSDKIEKATEDSKESIITTKDSIIEKVEESTSDVTGKAEDAVQKTGGFFSGLGKKIKGSAKDTKEEIASKARSGQEKIKEVAADKKVTIKESADKTGVFVGDIGEKMKDKSHDAKSSIQEFLSNEQNYATDSFQKVKETVKDTKENVKAEIDKTDPGVSDVKIRASETVKKVDTALTETSAQVKESTKDTKDNIEINLAKVEQLVMDETENLPKNFDVPKTDFVCYVTTPTMQRKGIGGSQRLSREERPALIDVSNMPADLSSDEDEYIVTEPTDNYENTPDKLDDSSPSSPFIIENIIEQGETLGSSLDDNKRRPLFHIGSRDEDSVDWGEKSGDKSIHLNEKEIQPDTDNITPEAQLDIDLIENKLAELGKALDDLEKVDLELEPQNDSDTKAERKLKRVERRFERMASETMEKDIKEAKDSKLTSPEVEAKREEEYRKMVSQLSQEEVSECQKLYTNLWDDITFTPSEEWDSKTPDSQPDDIQDLPQGEVVYMAPVTLNKNHSINKAGIEVDVIPIKRSPCTSPLPKRKLENKGRAKSAMGFYKEKQVDERGSLPDLQNTGKIGDVIQKGSIMSAIFKHPTILKEKSPHTSSSSLFIYNPGRRLSTDSLTKGSVVSAVKDWMAKATPFGSTDNIATSLADTTSIFDDDDNDSIDMFSDSACQLETESSKSDPNIPEIYISSENIPYDLTAIKRVVYNLDQYSLGETSGGPLTNTEGATHPTNLSELTTEIPKPIPRIDKTPDSGKTEVYEKDTSEIVTEDIAYSDRKKFWETVSSSKEGPPEIPIKKRMSLYEEQILKSTQENISAKKRTSVHEIGVVPPVPKPRSTLPQLSTEEPDENQTKHITETLVSEYKASFKNPTVLSEQIRNDKQQSESIDSEAEYLKYEHQTYENPGYVSDDQETEQVIEKPEVLAQVKRRQMSISQPPVAAVRKTIFERSVSLPTEDLQDVSDTSVRARKQFFEQQLKKEMVIDQLMTQLEEEELQEYKTLTSTEELSKVMSPEEKLKIDSIISSVRESDKNIDKDFKEIEKKLSPISSSSSQDTRTEDDITQYTPTSVKDLQKYFQSSSLGDTSILSDTQQSLKTKVILEVDESVSKSKDEDTGMAKEFSNQKQSSTESEQSISSERSIEFGSIHELASQVAEVLQYRSDSISKPSDSLEVHVDKSEIEDSEKGTDIDQDGTDIEVKSIGAESFLSDMTDTDIKIKEERSNDLGTEKFIDKISPIHKEVISNTIWEVSIQTQSSQELAESVSEIPLDRQVIVEKDEEFSAKDESDIGSEIHQDHSESFDSEKVRSDHSEVEQLILESLVHQKIHPDDARKIASELIDDIEAEIERRNLLQTEETEPPVPHPEVAKNQISDYLRQLAESKGLDAKEVELVESVLARKQSELSRLGRRDTQTSSMDITDEDLRYSGAECDISPSESHENILEEQIEQLQLENSLLNDKPDLDGEKFSEKNSDFKTQNIYVQQDREICTDDAIVSLKTQTSGKVDTSTSEEKDFARRSEQTFDDQSTVSKSTEENTHSKTDKEQINLQTEIDVKSELFTHSELIDTKATHDEQEVQTEKTSVEKTVSDKSEVETSTSEEVNKRKISLQGSQNLLAQTHEIIEGGFTDSTTAEKTKVSGESSEETENKLEHKQEITVLDDGTEIISEEIKENVHSKTVTTSEIVDHKHEEKTSVTTFVTEEPLTTFYEKQVQSDESKSSPYESAKSPEDQISSSSSMRKDDSDTSYAFDKPEVVFRKTKFHREVDTSSSSGKLKADRRSGADFEAYSSSGESHYHSFELDSAKSRPCSSDVEGLIAAGSSEYESALTSQDISSRSHITSTEYHTAVSSLSSRESMKSLDSESSGHMASIEVSEASETLVPSTFELEGDILDGAVSQLLEDEVADSKIIEPYDRNIPEHVIRGDYQMKDKKSSFDTISDSEIHGESMDISEEDSAQDKPLPGESKMKRSQEMTFQPIPKAIIADSPQSENAIEMDERFGSSLEDGSVLSISLSSQSDVTALRTVIELSRRDSESISASNMSLDKIQPIISTSTDSATSTGFHGTESPSSVTLTTSTVDENGTQSVCTQVTSQVATDEVYNGPTQVDYVPEYDDVVETKKMRGHRRQESTSTFVPSMIPGFTPRTDVLKESEKLITSTELTLKEEKNEEMKDVDETEDDRQGELDEPDLELVESLKQSLQDLEPVKTPEHQEKDIRGSHPSSPKSISDGNEKQEILYEKQFKMSISEKSSIEEGEAEAAFSMVAHISPAHKAKGDICPIMEDEDAEKHELETRERAQKEMEKRRAQIIRDQSPGSIPDIMVTEHMTPLVDREFHYPDLELEEKETLARSAPQTPASISSKSSEDTDQGREYILEDTTTSQVIPEEPELEESIEERQITEISHATTVEEKTIETDTREPDADSPNSDSFEMLEKPDIIDDFVVIEEVAKEAAEHDTEGKSVEIKPIKYIRKHDEEVEEYLVKSAPTPLTRMTDLKYYPDGNSSDELGPFDFEDSPPQAGKKSAGTKTASASQSLAYEYDKELEASKKWIEMQFQGDQTALMNAAYGYEMEFERGPLEDIKEEEATDFESSRIGSLDSQKQSVGSLGSVKDSFSSTPEYDVLAGRKFFTRSGEHDDVSMSSLQEFENLERIISLENRKHHQGSQDSSSNGSFSKRYNASRSGDGDGVSLSSLKEFEGLETACIEAHKIEIKAKEEEALLAQIDEAQENLISESESCKSLSSTDKKNLPESEEEDYEKRMFEIDEIIKQAQSNVEKFIDKDMHEKTESMGRGDSLEEIVKVPDLELDEPVKSTVHTVKWNTEDVMQTSADSLNLDLKPSHHESTDSLDIKTGTVDPMTQSTDSIEYQIQEKTERGMIQSDSIEINDQDRSCMITSDSLELTPGLIHATQMSDSIDEDGSRIGVNYDQSSSSGFSIKDEQEMRDQRAEYLLGSTDSLDPSSSTATHATYQYETDSVMSGSFTSGGSNTMVSSTDTIDPLSGQAHGVDIAAAVRKVWFDDDSFEPGSHFTTELLDDGSKPFVTEIIEPCEGDPEYSHTIHRKVELPPEVKKITFKGPNADLQLRQYIENFGEGEDVQESQEVDKDGNVHVKRVVQKRFIVKADPSGEEKRISGPELESYLQQVSAKPDEFDLDYEDPILTKQTVTDSDGTKTIYTQKFSTKYEQQGEESSVKQLLSSIASDVTSGYKLTRHVDTQQEQASGSSTTTFSGSAAANILRAQGSRRKPLRYDISVDDQTEVDPREHDWRFILPQHDEGTPENLDPNDPMNQQLRDVPDQHQLSTEMKELLEEMEKHSKQ